jgi:hypothetical protein
VKTLDVLGTGVKAAVAAVIAAVSPSPHRSREAKEELERRARINAEAEVERARRAQTWSRLLDDRQSWLGPRRSHWLR